MCPDPFPFSSTSVLSPSPCWLTTKSTSPSSLMHFVHLTNGCGWKHSAHTRRIQRCKLSRCIGFSFSSIQSKSTMSSLRMKKLRMKRNKTQIHKSMENKVEDTEVIHFHLLNCAAINFLTGRAQTESN